MEGVPPEAKRVLTALAEGVEAALGPTLAGLYLQGSLALGGFDCCSDLDFVAVLHRPLNPAEAARLAALHARLHRLAPPWSGRLEGSYASAAAWRRKTGDRSGAGFFYLDNGTERLVFDPHCDTHATRWVTRGHGLVLFGPPPDAWIDPVPADALRQEALEIFAAWQRFLAETPLGEGSAWLVTHSAATLARLALTVREGRVAPKPEAVAVEAAHLAPPQAAALRAAWAARPPPEAGSRAAADPALAAGVMDLARHIAARLGLG